MCVYTFCWISCLIWSNFFSVSYWIVWDNSSSVSSRLRGMLKKTYYFKRGTIVCWPSTHWTPRDLYCSTVFLFLYTDVFHLEFILLSVTIYTQLSAIVQKQKLRIKHTHAHKDIFPLFSFSLALAQPAFLSCTVL